MTAAADHVALPEAPEGTCIPVKRDSKRWWCKGKNGWYLIDPDTAECSCPASAYRRGPCRHCEMLRVVIAAQQALAEISPTVVAREEVAA